MEVSERELPPYAQSLAGTLLAAREAVMAPIRPFLRAAGVTEQQWRVLRVLADEGPIDPSHLARSSMLHAPSVTRILRELSDRRMIARTDDERDGRRSILQITERGRALMAATADQTLDLLEAYNQRFGRQRLDALRVELAEFTASIASLSEPTHD